MKWISHLPITLRRSVQAGAMMTASVLAAGCLAIPATALAQTQDNSQATMAPDNSGQNKTPGATADQQSNRKSDMTITKKIRQSIVADSALSTYAHNVKIITRHGKVTLKGPVKSEDEKQTVAAKAAEVTGNAKMVTNDLTVDTSGT